jgi:hypothetical protein
MAAASKRMGRSRPGLSDESMRKPSPHLLPATPWIESACSWRCKERVRQVRSRILTRQHWGECQGSRDVGNRGTDHRGLPVSQNVNNLADVVKAHPLLLRPAVRRLVLRSVCRFNRSIACLEVNSCNKRGIGKISQHLHQDEHA